VEGINIAGANCIAYIVDDIGQYGKVQRNDAVTTGGGEGIQQTCLTCSIHNTAESVSVTGTNCIAHVVGDVGQYSKVERHDAITTGSGEGVQQSHLTCSIHNTAESVSVTGTNCIAHVVGDVGQYSKVQRNDAVT